MFSLDSSRELRALTLCFALTLPLLACKRKQPEEGSRSSLSPEELGRLKTQADQFDAVIPKIKAEPDVTSADPFSTSIKQDELAVVGQAWLEEPNHKSDDETELELANGAMQACTAGSNTDKRLRFGECIKWRYVGVLRQKRFVRPKVAEDKQFEKGVFEGDLLVAELATGEIKGRYIVRIHSSDKLEVLSTHSKYEVQRKLDTDLRVKVRERVSARMLDLTTKLEED